MVPLECCPYSQILVYREKVGTDKHSRLFCLTISHKEKKFLTFILRLSLQQKHQKKPNKIFLYSKSFCSFNLNKVFVVV